MAWLKIAYIEVISGPCSLEESNHEIFEYKVMDIKNLEINRLRLGLQPNRRVQLMH
ncbi:unnamed protein product, partial [Sphenostylis stenocarpa]